MSRSLYGNLDLVLNQLLNTRLQMLGSDPSPTEAQVYYNSTTKSIRYHNGTIWVTLGVEGAGGGLPSGAVPGGDLTGSYPSPTIVAGAVTDAKVAAANKDGLAAVPSMRTLGTGATQAAAGNDTRFTDARTPSGTAGGELAGTYPNPTVKPLAITDAHVATANKDGLAGVPSMRTLGTTGTSAAAGNDTRFSDARTPSGTAGGDLAGSYPNPTLKAGNIDDADINTISTAKITGLDTALTGKVSTTRTITSGNGLTGGGTLAGDLTLAVGAGTGITVNADDIAINRTTVDAWYVDVGGDTMTGALTLSGDPTNPMHAATKQYVDIASQGLEYKASVKAASTANLTLSAPQTVDGVSLIAGDRVLVKDQTTPAQNGIYTVAAGAWVRAVDGDANGEIGDGTLIPVESGTLSSDSLWLCISTTTVPWVPNTSGSTWTKFSSLNELVAGNGLTKTGTQLDVGVVGPDLTVQADTITVVSAPKWTTARTITLGGDLTGNVSIDGTAGVTLTATLAATAANTIKRYAAALAATTVSQVITHNLNTRDVQVSIYNTASPYEEVWTEVQHTSVNTITIIANPAGLPTANYRVVVTA